MLDAAQAQRYLDLAGEVARSAPLVDVHVHATEVIFRDIRYHEASREAELLSAGDAPFRSPAVTAVRLEDPAASATRVDARIRNRVSRLAFTSAYQHVGRRVLLEHMALAHVQTALLLPVAPAEGGVEAQMRALAAMGAGEPRLLPGYSVPNTVPDEAIGLDLRQAVVTWDVRVVKLHPNLSGIDLRTEAGLRRVHQIVAACGESGLPLVVHGGRSPILEDEQASGHAAAERLERVDWGAGAAPVVLAHCGCFGCGRDEIATEALPALRRILERHSNVLADTSALHSDTLALALRVLDHDRLVFGSDALYYPMWQAVVQLLHALRSGGHPVHDSFARIASHNARRRLLRSEQSA